MNLRAHGHYSDSLPLSHVRNATVVVFFINALFKIIKNLSTQQKQTHIENRTVVAKGAGGGSGMDWEFGVSRLEPFYT